MNIYTIDNYKFLLKKQEFESDNQFSKRCKIFFNLYNKNKPRNMNDFQSIEYQSIIEYNKVYNNCH